MNFLREIGLDATLESGAKGFTDGVVVRKGALVVDPNAPISTLLHEAGHLAIVPAEFRANLSGNLAAGHRQMLDSLSREMIDPDDPRWRAAISCSDPEATAWAWAAGIHLGFSPGTIIRDADYDGEGALVRLALSLRAYPGIHGLAYAGFCCPRRPYGALPVFPNLAFWLQGGPIAASDVARAQIAGPLGSRFCTDFLPPTNKQRAS